ncbi:Uncharacterised protein [Mycobacterium tuberculosis]|nr:Uncharacterised protein [Mycobacterium tuberculosis]
MFDIQGFKKDSLSFEEAEKTNTLGYIAATGIQFKMYQIEILSN